MYCHARGCRDMVTSNGNGPFCFHHQQANIAEAAKHPVFLLGGGHGRSVCHVCLEMVSFHRNIIDEHEREDGICEGGRQEIAIFRTLKEKAVQKWRNRK